MAKVKRTIRLDGRRFIATVEDGVVARISERKVLNPGHPYLERVADQSYWTPQHHYSPGKPGSLINRLLTAATGPSQ